MKIRSKFLLFFVGWLVVLWVPTVLTFYYHAREDIKNATQETISHSTNIFQKTLSGFLEDRSFELSYLVSRIEKVSQKQDHDYIADILNDSKMNLKKFEALSIYDSERRKIVDTRNTNINSIFPWYFWKEVTHSEKAYISPKYDPNLKDQYLIIAKRINFKGRVGVLVAHISMDFVRSFLNEFNASVSSNEKINVELIDINGKIIFSNHNQKWIDGEEIVDANLLDVAKNSNGKITRLLPELQAISLPVRLFNETQWYLLFHYNPNELYDEANVYAKKMFAAFLISVFFAGAIAVYAAKTLAGPIEKLTHDLQHISLDNLEGFKPESYHGSKEIREMAVKISQMIFHLEVGLQQFHQKSRLQDLGEMAGGIAHEINNPITIIEGRARQVTSLINKKAPPEEINKCIESITNTTKRIAELIKNLRNLSRDAENDTFSIFSVYDIINTTLDVCRSSLTSKKIELITKYTEGDLSINCRPAQISQIILNLVNNASDAVLSDINSEEKWIQIKTSGDEEWVYVEVTNSGPKIPKELTTKLFRPFFTTKAPGRGTGIGLSLSKNFAQKHHGDLLLDISGDHTLFTLKLPRTTAIKLAA